MRSIKKFHMENFIGYAIDRTNAGRYVVFCRKKICMFRLEASYRKKSDTLEISLMDLPHSCTTTIFLQDHHKLISQLICQDIQPIIRKDPSVKVSIIISNIVTRFNYTTSYMKKWITRIKTVGHVYINWKKSYN